MKENSNYNMNSLLNLDSANIPTLKKVYNIDTKSSIN